MSSSNSDAAGRRKGKRGYWQNKNKNKNKSKDKNKNRKSKRSEYDAGEWSGSVAVKQLKAAWLARLSWSRVTVFAAGDCSGGSASSASLIRFDVGGHTEFVFDDVLSDGVALKRRFKGRGKGKAKGTVANLGLKVKVLLQVDTEEEEEEEIGQEPLGSDKLYEYDSDDDYVCKPKSTVNSPRRRRNRARNHSCGDSELTFSSEPLVFYGPKVSKVVSFGNVLVADYPRELGTGVVPSENCWPLGLASGSPVREYWGDVETFERRRWKDINDRENKLGSDVVKTGETRQYDHLKGTRNAIFSRLREKARTEILSESVDPTNHTTNNFLGYGGRRRSLSVEDVEQMVNGSMDKIQDLQRSNKLFAKECADIRDSRANAGCNCAPLKTKGMRPARLVEELSKRNLPTDGTKEERKERLRLALSDEKCCTFDCSCAEAGIECHADVCLCRTSSAKWGWEQPSKVACGNPLRMYLPEFDAIKRHRDKTLNAPSREGYII